MRQTYSCKRCMAPTGPHGHGENVCKKSGVHGPRHFCCPGNCQLEHPEEFQADIDMFIRLGHEQLTEEPTKVLEFIRANRSRED